MKLNLFTKAIMGIVFVIHIGNASIYEDAEHKNTSNWEIYSNSSGSAEALNIYDTEQNSRVIQFNEKSGNGYIIGYWEGDARAWNNTDGHILEWDFKYEGRLTFYIRVQTNNGHKYLYYAYGSREGIYSGGRYIKHNLGTKPKVGTWQSFKRNLKEDLKEFGGDNELIAVNAFLIRGSGSIDNLKLSSEKDDTTPTLTPPTANAGVNKSVQLSGTLSITGTGIKGSGSITSYKWYRGSKIIATTASFTYTPLALGTDTLTFSVLDDNGLESKDSLKIVVSADDDAPTNDLKSTIYEDAEHKNTSNWEIYSNSSGSAEALNIYDTEQNSRVIQFNEKSGNGYIIGHWEGDARAWNNTNGHILEWDFKYEGRLTFYIRVQTNNGNKYLYYAYGSREGIYNGGRYIKHNLGTKPKVGTWQSFKRDLKKDLKKFGGDNELIAVNAFLIRGSGSIDNLKLSSEEDDTTPTLTPPTANAGVDKSVQLSGTLSITGTGIKGSGSITSYRWYRGSTIIATTASFTYTPLALGTDTLTFSVLDDNGLESKDSLKIVVKADDVINTFAFVNTPSVSNISSTSAQINWSVSANSTAQVQYGLSNTYGSTSTLVSTYNSSKHKHKLSSLTANTTYHYRVLSVNAQGHELSSTNATFTTASTTTTTPNFILPAMKKGKNWFNSTKKGQWRLGYPDNIFGVNLNYNSSEKAYYIKTVNETFKSNGTRNRNGWLSSIYSPSFYLDPTKNYQLVLKMKATSFPKGQNVMFTLRGPKGDSKSKWETLWNVSKENTWEEVIIPIYPSSINNPKNNKWEISIFSSLAYSAYENSNSQILISEDIDIFELKKGRELDAVKEIDIQRDKIAFENSYRKIDELGNYYIKEDDGSWKHIFPKLMYYDHNRKDYASMFATYKAYGFTGIMDIIRVSELDAALKVGLTYNAIEASGRRDKNDNIKYAEMQSYYDTLHQYVDSKNLHRNLLWYNFDNEKNNPADFEYQEWLADYADAHLDSATGKRLYPLYYRNGRKGLVRTYLNDSRKTMDMTGAYVGDDKHGDVKDGKKDLDARILTHFLTPNQKAPCTVIQLEKQFAQKFIPSLFYGLIQGGRALAVWRDGTTHIDNIYDFRNTIWGDAFKNDVSPKLDQLLPLIKEPQFTTWLAESNKFPEVRMGTRELNGVGYLILANFSDENKQVKVTLDGISASTVVDYFTNKKITTVANNSFSFTIGHHNNGYKVLKLIP